MRQFLLNQMQSLVTRKVYSDVPYGTVGPQRMINMRLNRSLMENVATFCSENDVTLKMMTEVCLLMGLADEQMPAVVRELRDRLRAEKRANYLSKKRLLKHRKLL